MRKSFINILRNFADCINPLGKFILEPRHEKCVQYVNASMYNVYISAIALDKRINQKKKKHFLRISQ